MRKLNKQFLNGMRMVLPVLLPLAITSVARADDSDPSARVARLGYVQGQVSIEPAGVDEWAAADLNRPLTTGDKLWLDADSRVELSIGSAVVRLGSATGFSFLNLDDHTAQMQVTAGTASVHVRTMDENDTLEVDTPNSVVSLLGPGDYRVEVNDAGDTSVVKVSGGTAEVSAGRQEFPVHPQQQITLTGTDAVSAVVGSLGAPDAFDSWSLERDRRTQVAQTSNYVSPDVIGAEDLDQNGTWQSTPEDGYVWAPNTVAVGWAPYRYGHWAWISPWGWTWIDDAAWGFAPFHYGRWATFGGRWCWVPGPPRRRPVYAPALVAWVGGAPVGASAAFGGNAGVAWFPLGPREVYVPAYPVSQTYVRNINVSNTTVNNTYITNVYNHNIKDIHYVNRNAPGAITAVSQTTFTTAQPVGRNVVRLSRNELAAATTSTTTPPITPARQSVLGGGATGRGVRRPPLALQNRAVFAKTPPPPAPVPFAAQQQAIHANGGRPIARAELKSLGVYAPAAQVRMTAPASGAESRSGMNRAARPEPAAPAIRPAVPRATFDHPQSAAPVGPPQSIVHPPVAPQSAAPQREAQPPARGDRPPTAAPVVPPQSIVHPPVAPQSVAPQREAQPPARGDRQPTAFGQPRIEERARANDVPRPAEARSPVAQDLNRRVDRPAAPPPAPGPPPVQVARPPPPEPKAKPAPSAEKPTQPATRNNN
jgi:hypothetical protein